MVTIHLTDAQRDTFAAGGIIVIDGQCEGCHDVLTHRQIHGSLPEPGWRILTEPCDTCGGRAVVLRHHIDTDYGEWDEPFPRPCPNPDCVGGRRVVTLAATCPTCDGRGVKPYELLTLPERWEWATGGKSVGHLPQLRCCDDCEDTPGVVTLGRFTIPALLPVIDYVPWPDDGPGESLIVIGDSVCHFRPGTGERMERLTLDPLPRPGQFIARPERVE